MKNNSYPEISVIIPVFNCDKYISYAVESVLNQTFPNFELICVNDGSTDNSLEILMKMAAKDLRVQVINQPNEGVSQARNVALEQAKGRYITFLDADDMLESDHLKDMLSLAKQTDADVVVTNFAYFSENNLSDLKKKDMYQNECVHGQTALERIFTTSTVTWNKLYKRKCIGNIRFSPKFKIGEDGLFVLEVVRQADIVAFSSEAKYYYRIRMDGACNNKLSVSAFDGVESSVLHRSLLLGIDSCFKQIGDFRVLRACCLLLKRFENYDDEKESYRKQLATMKKHLKKVYNPLSKNKYISWKQHLFIGMYLINDNIAIRTMMKRI